MFLLKLSVRPWRLAPLSHVFSAAAVGFLLLLVGFLFWMQAGLRPVLARLQGEQVVTAYLDATVETKDEPKIVDSIRTAMGAHPEAGNKAATGPEVRLIGAQQFVDNIKDTYPELAHELQDLGQEMTAVVPRYISVSGILPEQSLETVKAVPGVESVESSKDRYAHIVGAFLALRWIAKLLIVGVCFALLTGLIHLSRMNAYMHRDALAILKLWGASATEMRAPGMISGAIVGALGGTMACAAWLSTGQWLGRQVRALSPMLREMPQSSLGLAAGLLGAGILIGIFAGALGGVANPSESSSGSGSSGLRG